MKAADAKKIEKMMEKNQQTEKKIKTFEKLLDEMSGVEPQKMHLWLEIYNNATNDRTTASALFTQGFMQLGDSSADHITIGPTLVKYLERMTKSNDQLLSLSQIISKEVEKQTAVDTDDIFSKIEEQK